VELKLIAREVVTAYLFVALIVTTAGQGQTHEQQDRSAPNSFVDWVVPAVPPNHPQTPGEEEVGRNQGRKLPPPELLQPTLDSKLRDYRPVSAGLSGTYKAAASDVLPGLVKQWIAEFHKYYPKVVIDLEPPYAGSLGAKELVKGNLDIVFVSRELKPDDITDFKARFGYDPLSVPICGGSYRHFGFLDAVVFFANKDNPIEKLTFDQVDGILSSTHLRSGKAYTTWGDLGLSGEWADKPIHMYGVRPWNGFEEFVRQRVLSLPGKRGEWRDGINFEKVVFPLASHVAQDRYGIGYSGVAYIDAGVRVLPLSENQNEGFYAPSYENVALAKYPLARLIYANLNAAAGTPPPPALKEFLTFIVSKQGQQVVLAQAIYLPLRGWQSEKSLSLIGN
jgi:phosphate transport system substrate-binding protein